MPLCLIAAVILAWPNALVLLAAVMIVALLWCGVSWAMGRIGAVLQAPRLWFSAPLLAWGRPLVNAYYRLREARNQRSNYTSYH